MTSGEVLTPRESGKLIAENAQHITICEDGISKCAKELYNRIMKGQIKLTRDIKNDKGDEGNYFKKSMVHPQTADNTGIDWVFFLDALNFSFWNFSSGENKQYQVTYKDITYTGYLAFCAAVCRTLDSGTPLTTPTFYANLTENQLSTFLMGDNQVVCPLIKERVSCLHEIGEVLKKKFNSSFVNCLIHCERYGEHKAQKLLNLVRNEFPCFRDEAEYQPIACKPAIKVSFMKRAQILIADVWSLFEGQGHGRFHDIDSLTMFADYRVPQSLQYFGAFKYSEKLFDELSKPEHILEHGCTYEIEIRGCSIEAVTRVVHETRRLLLEANQKPFVECLNCVITDYFLWGFRREKAEEMERFPYHKVRSIYY